ncbi:MAG: hypothetical protein AAF934_05775 [Bacteroidota bacterium]
MENITLELTVEEANTILAALGQQSYIKVVDLIQKIQGQGASQLDRSKAKDFTKKPKEVKNAILSKNGQ